MTTRTRTRNVLYAGMIAVAASGCSTFGGKRASADNPSARRVEASQEQSKEALSSAAKAQEEASKQQEQAAEAQRDVQEAQRRLTEAQQRAERETAEAEQAQQQANQRTSQATQEAQQAQQQASRQLDQQQQIVSRGEQVVTGEVRRATPQQLVVQPQSGEPMTFAITPQTRVQIDGRQASAAQLTPGEDAHVSYEMAGTEPTALLVQVVTGSTTTGAPPASQSGTGAGSGTGDTGTGSTGARGGAGSGGTTGTTPPERAR
ncbi:hypothetical protein [Anaeromyxobacter sp. Fw109-5]|uniref:hypothetical protein n=1 Tax=Anaeromyxobacter sp. (strain Fw109-5) TaxID=404589 RepID=UPI0000ED7E53|nr:hypothetical protein [Anaeromyxobacter sp. Fw109-5]ABS25832.1 conserved hypothetical protein [Anaeromyxobacter sp. Fw109-5]